MTGKMRMWVFSAVLASMLFMSAPPALAWFFGTPKSSGVGFGSTNNGGILINIFGIHIVFGGHNSMAATSPPVTNVNARGALTVPSGGQGCVLPSRKAIGGFYSME